MNFAEKMTNAQVGLIIGAIAVIVILVVWRLVHKRMVRGSGFPIDIAPEEPKPVFADEHASISRADAKPTVVILPEDPLPYAKPILASEPIVVEAPAVDAAPVEPVKEMPVELTPVTPAEPQPEPQPVEEPVQPKETAAVETDEVKPVRKRVRKAPAKAPFAKTKNPARTVTKATPKKVTAPKKAKTSSKNAADTKKTAKSAKTTKAAPAKKTTKKAK